MRCILYCIPNEIIAIEDEVKWLLYYERAEKSRSDESKSKLKLELHVIPIQMHMRCMRVLVECLLTDADSLTGKMSKRL